MTSTAPSAPVARDWRVHAAPAGWWLALILAVWSLADYGSDIWASEFSPQWQRRPKPVFLTAQFMFHVPLLLLPMVVFRRRLTLGLGMAAVAAAGVIETSGLVDYRLHAFLFQSRLYPGFLASGPDGFVNQQYAKLLLYAVAVAAFGVAAAFWTLRGGWTIDRVIVGLVSGAALSTTLLFHLVIVNGSLVEVRDRRLALMAAALEFDDRSFRRLCGSLRWECGSVPAAILFDQSTGKNNAAVQAMQRRLSDQPGAFNIWTESVDRGDGLVFNVLYGLRKAEGVTRVIVDEVAYGRINDRHQRWFSVLALAAQTVWTFGGLGLLFFHHRRWAARQAT